MSIRPTAYEFFAGGGLAGLGLSGAGLSGQRWAGVDTVFANDMDPAKGRAFVANHPDIRFHLGDVWSLRPADLPGAPDLAWASSPCQDVSLAGARGGLEAGRSGAFWGFWRLIQGLAVEGRAPRVIVLENVIGLLTSGPKDETGRDFSAVCAAMVQAGYRVGALEMDAAHWLPQSRPPPRRNLDLAALLEPDESVEWLDDGAEILALAAPLHRARIEAAVASGRRVVGAAYRRVRTEDGRKVQRLEIRFDGLAGCLRTPAGGSSRQYVVVCDGGRTRVRRLTGREAARLMGVSDDYRLPDSESAALKLMGDAVAVPVVRALTEGLLLPALSSRRTAA
ncbi:MAG: DNA (cytosine-5-)-methyltransferase [Brevundimonas sp. 32-68-21]|nr:MAG: DNA (cytosine-5-)-methyltransferase [Brevundimonas sp. 32-68-21]